MKELVIVGDSAFAEVAHQYFSYDSEYRVIGFAVEKAFKKQDTLLSLDVFDLEELPQRFVGKKLFFHVAVTYRNLNTLRFRLIERMKDFGFIPASYVSSRAFIWKNVNLGEHVFIFEDNTIQPFSKIGNNVVLWSGNHIGHHSTIKDNVFVSSQVVISGFCNIGNNCFLGVNSTISNNVTIGNFSWIGPRALVERNLRDDSLVRSEPSESLKISAKRFFKAE